MNKKYLKFVLGFIIFIISTCSTDYIAFAASNTNQAGFTVERIDHSHQYNNNISYFDLKLKPGEKLIFKLK